MEQRRIGPNIIRAVELLERMGEARVSAGRPQKDDQRISLDNRALRRAVQYGLVTRTETKPYVYRPCHEWRDALKGQRPQIATNRPVASVWDWASAN